MSIRLKDNISSNVSGNATSATKLQTARTINGVAFDGSANITTPNISTGGNITLHADSDSSSTGEYAIIKAGGNELKVTSSAGGSSPAKNNSNLTFNGNIVYNAGRKPTPSEIGALYGSKISATTAATAQWYRIAQTSSTDQGNTIGTFTIRAAVSGNHSSTIITAGITFGQNPTLNQLSHTQYTGVGLTKARIVYHTTYSGNRAYLEVYVPDTKTRTIEVELEGSMGWTLVTPNTVGSIPSGYTNKEITFSVNKIVSDISGSITGNSATTTKLQTARTINGVAFDGSANITITANPNSHTHDDRYYTESEVNSLLNNKANSSHSHTNIESRGSVTCETGTTLPALTGISMSNVYNNGYPTTYGNVLTMRGGGHGQLLIGWSGTSGATAPAYIRSKRDTTDANWSAWKRILTEDDYNQLFQYASNGKSAIATAITGKGVSASANDTFATLASKINQLGALKRVTGTIMSTRSTYKREYINMSDISKQCSFTPKFIACQLTLNTTGGIVIYANDNGIAYGVSKYSSSKQSFFSSITDNLLIYDGNYSSSYPTEVGIQTPVNFVAVG